MMRGLPIPGLAGISLNQRFFLAFLLLLVWAPLPVGSNRPWAWAIIEAWAFLLGACWLWFWLKGRVHISTAFHKAMPVLVLFVLWLGYLVLQFLPLPFSWVSRFSPLAAQLQAEASAGALPDWATLSVDPHTTVAYWLKSCAYFVVFTMALLLVDCPRRARQLMVVLVFGGVFQALYGSLMTLTGLEYGFFVRKVDYLGVATGTFINRNHLAGYLEMCLAMGIGLFISGLGRGVSANWRQRVRGWLQWIFSSRMRLRLYLIIMVIGLILTRSRMGNAAFFISLTFAGLAGLILYRRMQRKMALLLVSLIVIDLFLVGSWVGMEKVAYRLEETSLVHETRDEVSRYTARMWQDYFWFGSGGGSFHAAFPAYRQGDIRIFYDHAHNDYLELATEHGLIGLALLGLIVAVSVMTAIRALNSRHHPLMRSLAFSSLMGCTALLIHSSVDFNLQIPANAMLFVVLLALAWIALHAGAMSRHR